MNRLPGSAHGLLSLLRGSAFKLALASVVAGALYGQSFYGSVVGTITDPSGAAVRGANVALTNTGTGVRSQAQAGANGEYQFLNLVPGAYRVDVEQTGFKKATLPKVDVTVSGTFRADITMQLGEVTQSVEVSAAAPLLQTENANLSHVVNSRSVDELPVNGRNVLNLIALVPGVVPQGTTDGNALTGKNIFAAGNYQIGGGFANQSAVYFDGVPANAALGNMVNMVPSPDAVSEFRVQTNSNSSEFGRYAGGVVNISSRSGTNEFHGSAYEFFRNTVLNANSFFANANRTGKQPFKQNQYGITGGGPILKNKMFFFAAWEGFKSRQASPYNATVPPTSFYTGDFSGYRNASNAMIPIYDPLTQCGTGANAACVAGQTIQRQVFPGNVIPSSRINPVAAKIFGFPLVAPPNLPGIPFTQQNNYSKLASQGGNNDQVNGRLDYSVTNKLRIFTRYSRWQSENLSFAPFGNGIFANDPYAPEQFTTTQAVAGATYLLSPSMVLDVRASYVRFPYIRDQSFTGISLSKTFGFPAYMDEQLPIIHGGPSTSIPSISVAGYTTASGLHILSGENDYLLTPSLSWVRGRHTFKFGADWRDMQNTYYQTFDGGSFAFTAAFTAQNALVPGASGNGLASALLGFGSSGTQTAFAFPYQSLNYQGYFAQDTWQVTNKLTVTAGVRWEIPGVWKERYNRIASFNPYALNPATSNIKVNGQPVLGALEFAGTPQHPYKGFRTEHFDLFAPRVGLAYRVNDKTVVRTGAGIYYLPSNLQFSEAPWGMTLSQFGNPWLATLDNSVTPNFTLSNPFPNGFTLAPANLPQAQAQAVLIGGGLTAPLGTIPYPYQPQWNFTVQHQTWGGVAIEAAYAGSRGVHLPRGGYQSNALPTKYLSLGSALNTLVPNPFYGLVKTGTLSQPTVQQGQLLLPFPQYTGVTQAGGYLGNSTYHSLQMKVEKRFASAGTVVGAYTFSKLLGDVSSLTGWLDSGVGQAPGAQDLYNLRAEKTVSGFDSRQRLTVSYAVDLPFGKGHRFLNGGGSGVQRLTSGWSVSGTSTFQDGFPLALTATPLATVGFNVGLRPNVVAGCNPAKSGQASSRLTGWFNSSCYTVPPAYTLGNLSATDARVRGHGIANYNFALLKRTAITERIKAEFRGEVFNVFNRVQFALPNTTITTAANPTTGFITSTVNQPRLVQLALRIIY